MCPASDPEGKKKNNNNDYVGIKDNTHNTQVYNDNGNHDNIDDGDDDAKTTDIKAVSITTVLRAAFPKSPTYLPETKARFVGNGSDVEGEGAPLRNQQLREGLEATKGAPDCVGGDGSVADVSGTHLFGKTGLGG